MSIMEEATIEPINLNRKDITAEITGIDLELGDEGDQQEPRPEQPEELNPLVGVLDMLIGSSGDILKEYGYPEPNLTIWEKWGKENLSKALNHYMPAGLGENMSSPAIAGLIGIGAILICFMPVIMTFVKHVQEPQPEQIPQQPEPDEEPKEKHEYVNTYEEPQPVVSTAPISDKVLKAWERVQRIDNGY